jgi:hypothetical protein
MRSGKKCGNVSMDFQSITEVQCRYIHTYFSVQGMDQRENDPI